MKDRIVSKGWEIPLKTNILYCQFCQELVTFYWECHWWKWSLLHILENYLALCGEHSKWDWRILKELLTQLGVQFGFWRHTLKFCLKMTKDNLTAQYLIMKWIKSNTNLSSRITLFARCFHLLKCTDIWFFMQIE